MEKFVVLINDIPYGYEKYQIEAASRYGAVVSKTIPPGMKRMLYKLHNSWTLNSKFEMPLKSVWYKEILNENELSVNDDIYFLFYESFKLTYSKKYLKYLKKKYKRSKFIYVFTNPPGRDNFFKIKEIEKYYDSFLTDVKSSALEYGYDFYPVNPYYLPKPVNDDVEYDVFFVGANKGRLQQILSVYEKLTAQGLKCDFYVTGVEEQEQKYSESIHYNTWLAYDNVLDHINKSKAILEIIQDNLDYYTFRVYEAMLLKKKLITTNLKIKNTDLYAPEIIYVTTIDSDMKDVLQFVNRCCVEDYYPPKDYWSFDNLASHIKKYMQGE